jgi:phosphoribosylaminoimidazole-succinocarboxamide synthase
MKPALTQIRMGSLRPLHSGKVREMYDAGDGRLLMVTTDRISAYDHVLASGIPGKGSILNRMSAFWFRGLEGRIPTHFITDDPREFPERFAPYGGILSGRSMLVRAGKRVDFECVVRGFLAGSAWAEYEATGVVAGMRLAPGLGKFAKLGEPIFTPATKEESGHDRNVTYEEFAQAAGGGLAEVLRETSLSIYAAASRYAFERGIVIADTKFEYGIVEGRVTLIDEVLSPDSSRFWRREEWERGAALDPLDKQYVREHLNRVGWDRNPPAPPLPPEIVEGASSRYAEACARIVGDDAAPVWSTERI